MSSAPEEKKESVRGKTLVLSVTFSRGVPCIVVVARHGTPKYWAFVVSRGRDPRVKEIDADGGSVTFHVSPRVADHMVRLMDSGGSSVCCLVNLEAGTAVAMVDKMVQDPPTLVLALERLDSILQQTTKRKFDDCEAAAQQRPPEFAKNMARHTCIGVEPSLS